MLLLHFLFYFNLKWKKGKAAEDDMKIFAPFHQVFLKYCLRVQSSIATQKHIVKKHIITSNYLIHTFHFHIIHY